MKRMLHKVGKKPRTQQPVRPLERQHSRAFLALSVLLVLVFAMGGASRADVASLPVLRPAATAFLFLGLYWLRQEHFKAHSFLLLWGAACAVLVLAQLIPLPPAVWQSLPGRELIVQIGQAAELNDIWRPLTMTPAATRNAFWSLMPPLATLVLAVQLEPGEHKKVLTLIIVLGLTSALLGMLQLLGDPSGPLYFYAVTGNGSAVGLFANRNHQALLLAALLALSALCVARGSRCICSRRRPPAPRPPEFSPAPPHRSLGLGGPKRKAGAAPRPLTPADCVWRTHSIPPGPPCLRRVAYNRAAGAVAGLRPHGLAGHFFLSGFLLQPPACAAAARAVPVWPRARALCTAWAVVEELALGTAVAAAGRPCAAAGADVAARAASAAMRVRFTAGAPSRRVGPTRALTIC